MSDVLCLMSNGCAQGFLLFLFYYRYVKLIRKKYHEKQGILEDRDSGHRNSADGTDNNARSYELYVERKSAEETQRFFSFLHPYKLKSFVPL